MLCFLAPVSMFVLVPVQLAVAIVVMRQNRSPGPHRMLGFTLGALALTLFAGTVLAFLMTSALFPSGISVYGYSVSAGYSIPTVLPRRILPENTAEAGGIPERRTLAPNDPILLGVTMTIAAATNAAASAKTDVWVLTDAPATMTGVESSAAAEATPAATTPTED
jgi:hypothetical protein